MAKNLHSEGVFAEIWVPVSIAAVFGACWAEWKGDTVMEC
jgi:hypothetical protein